jgi:hypothetical protein
VVLCVPLALVGLVGLLLGTLVLVAVRGSVLIVETSPAVLALEMVGLLIMLLFGVLLIVRICRGTGLPRI